MSCVFFRSIHLDRTVNAMLIRLSNITIGMPSADIATMHTPPYHLATPE